MRLLRSFSCWLFSAFNCSFRCDIGVRHILVVYVFLYVLIGGAAWILISASNLSGVEFGPGPLDPYGQFKLLKPTAVIDQGVFVFDGTFDMSLAAAIGKVQKARNLAQAKQLDRAMLEAQEAVVLAPESIQTQLALGDVLLEMGRREEARARFERALEIAKTIEPEFQVRSVPEIEKRIGALEP